MTIRRVLSAFRRLPVALRRQTAALPWAWVGLLVSAASGTCGQPPDVDVNRLVPLVAEAVAADQTLAGAWLHVDGEGNGAGGRRAVFRRILDADRADSQAAAMDRIIASLELPVGGWRIDEAKDARVPYGRLAERLRQLIEQDPRFEGCNFLGSFYHEDDAGGSLGWAPRFEVVRERPDSTAERMDLRDPELQYDALMVECRKLFAADPDWKRAGLSVVDQLVDRQRLVVDRPAGPELNALAREIAAAIQADPSLEGTWLRVERDDQGAPNVAPMIYEFQRVLDQDRAGPQAEALDALIRRMVPPGRYRVDVARDVRLPYERMTSALRDAMHRDPRFDGCKFLGGSYADSPNDSLGWAPRFMVVEEFDPVEKTRSGLRNPERQFEALVLECRKLFAAEPRWKNSGISVIDNLPEERGQRQIRRELAGPTEQEVVRRIAAAIKDEPALRGSWLEVRLDDQGAPEVAPVIYTFHRGFDSSRVASQTTALESLMKRLVPSGRRRIDAAKDVMVPLTDLIQSVNSQADLDPDYAGCLMSGAFYVRSSDEGSWNLVPEGRVWQAAQVQSVRQLVLDTMASDPAWAGNMVGMEAATKLVLVGPNPGVASHHFSEGMKRFWDGDYRGADEILRLASLESPDNVVYRYWRVLAELADGDQAAGETRLARTIAGFGVQRHSATHQQVLRSIYRVQGPLRYALIRAEDKAMVGLTTGGGVVQPWGLN